VDRGVTVVGIDDLSWGYEADVPEGVLNLPADITVLDRLIETNVRVFPRPVDEQDHHQVGISVGELFSDTDVVIHCAASLEVTRPLSDPVQDLKINTLGTLQVLEAMRQHGVKNLINFSSACVYGRGAYDMRRSQEEDATVTSPHWGYASSKLAAEIYCSQYSKIYDFNVFNLRPGIVCGPREWYGRALTIFLSRALAGQLIVVFVNKGHTLQKRLSNHDGTPRRDFVHVEDVCRMVDHILVDYPRHFSGCKTFNVGTGARHSILQLAHKVAEKYGVQCVLEEVEEGKMSQLVEGRIRIPYEMKSMWLEMEKAKILGFLPSLTLDNILEDEVDWLSHGDNLGRWNRAEMKV